MSKILYDKQNVIMKKLFAELGKIFKSPKESILSLSWLGKQCVVLQREMRIRFSTDLEINVPTPCITELYCSKSEHLNTFNN